MQLVDVIHGSLRRGFVQRFESLTRRDLVSRDVTKSLRPLLEQEQIAYVYIYMYIYKSLSTSNDTRVPYYDIISNVKVWELRRQKFMIVS